MKINRALCSFSRKVWSLRIDAQRHYFSPDDFLLNNAEGWQVKSDPKRILPTRIMLNHRTLGVPPAKHDNHLVNVRVGGNFVEEIDDEVSFGI
jgi:hypothetical protein